MSFRCPDCGHAFPNSTHDECRPTKVVTKIRTLEEGRWEIAEERSLCARCASLRPSVIPKTYVPSSIEIGTPILPTA